MLRNISHTASIRFAILHTALFFASAIVLGVVLYFDAQQSLETQMRDRISAEVQQLMVDYRQDGIEELRHDIRERIEANSTNRLRYHIQNAKGQGIFDTFPPLPPQKGWHHQEPLLFYTHLLNEGYVLAIGGELTAVRDMQKIILHALGISVFLASFLALLGGLLISRRFLKRVDTLRNTAELVGTGDLSQRIPMSGVGDEFDQLANIINKMLNRIETLMQEVQHVTTNIAHDLRTPLTQLRNQLETMPDNDKAILALDHMLETFNSLLRIAEVESGERREDFKKIDLSVLVAELVEAYAGVAEENSVHIQCCILPEITIYGDRHLLIQMLANLIENALKYGGKEMIIAVTKDAIIIQDNGPGIPESEFENITKPFYRLDRSRSSKGNGLGLSLVAAIANLHSMSLIFEKSYPGLKITIAFR